MELKGSRTEANLWAAFAGESQAHTKYLYYASKAKKDGYVQISKLSVNSLSFFLIFSSFFLHFMFYNTFSKV